MSSEFNSGDVLYVDVTQTWRSDIQGGIQRVVRQIVSCWKNQDANISLIVFFEGNYHVLPKENLSNFASLYTSRVPDGVRTQQSIYRFLLPIYLKIKKLLPFNIFKILLRSKPISHGRKFLVDSWFPEDAVVLDPENKKILLLDLVTDDEQIEYLRFITRNSNSELILFGYDCNPIVAPAFYPAEVVEVFPSYIAIANIARKVWSISKTAESDIKRFSKTILQDEAFHVEWLPPSDFPKCNHPDIFEGKLEVEEYILMVSSFTPNKNHLGLLNAMQSLHTQGVNIPILYLAGSYSWDIKEIDRKIDELALLGVTVRKFTNIDDCCIGKLYENSTFSILPSFVEGFGLPIVESLSFGKPVVTSDVTSTGELLSLPGTIGFSLTAAPSLDEVLKRLFTDSGFLEGLTTQAQKNRNNLGSWDEYSRALLKFATEGLQK